jgi:hypothetical protein
MKFANYFRHTERDLNELTYIKSDKKRVIAHKILEDWQPSNNVPNKISNKEFKALYFNNFITVKEKTGAKITMFPLLFWLNALLSLMQLCVFGGFLLLLLTQHDKTLEMYCAAMLTSLFIVFVKVQIYKTMIRPIQILMQKYYFSERYNNYY